jgi:SAM-dependent methyltransferase
LDAGCAYGYVTKDRFADIPNAFVLGVDRSQACLDTARQSYSAPNIVYEKLDLESEDFNDELEDLMDKHDIPKFDIIFSSLVIHHLSNPQKFLRRLRRYLADDGFIIIRGSDDGSVMTYNDDGLIDKIITLHLSTDGISDRENGRKIYHQLITSGYKNVKMINYIKDLSGLNLDQRYEFYLERYDYRKNYLKMVADKDPYNMEKRNNYEYMKLLLEELENKFADKSFWCCEIDFVGIAQKDNI